MSSHHKRGREEWLRDVADRQRNIVFPDTVQNERRFWRNLYEGKGLSGFQRFAGFLWIGLVICGTLLMVAAVLHNGPGVNVRDRALGFAIGFGLIGAMLAGFLALITWQLRRDRRTKTHRPHR